MAKDVGDNPQPRKRHRPPPRLRSFPYKGSFAYSLTICCDCRKPLLTGPDRIAKLRALLEDCADKHHFQIWAYCFMPDHLHLLVSGNGDSSLKDFIKLFKQASGYWHKHESGEKLWQDSYFDHVLRRDEDLLRVARYVFENASRKGLVKNWCDHPFMGPEDVVRSLDDQ